MTKHFPMWFVFHSFELYLPMQFKMIDCSSNGCGYSIFERHPG